MSTIIMLIGLYIKNSKMIKIVPIKVSQIDNSEDK